MPRSRSFGARRIFPPASKSIIYFGSKDLKRSWILLSTKWTIDPRKTPMQAPIKTPMVAPSIVVILREKSERAKPTTPPYAAHTNAAPIVT